MVQNPISVIASCDFYQDQTTDRVFSGYRGLTRFDGPLTTSKILGGPRRSLAVTGSDVIGCQMLDWQSLADWVTPSRHSRRV
jgi:hypothetical protein